MRLLVKLYVVLIGTVAVLLLGHDLSVLALWPHTWSPWVTIALIVLAVVGDHLQFEVRRGWSTNASAVAHIAACFLLPPAGAMPIAAFRGIVRAFRFPLPLPQAGFNGVSI